MPDTLRHRTIQLAATLQPGSSEREALLSVLASERFASSDEDVAEWIIRSYPEKGDGAFVVRGLPYVGQNAASEMLESLRSYFASRPFVTEIQRAVQEVLDPERSVITIEAQEEAAKLYRAHSREFFHDMYRMHGNGRQKFRDAPGTYRAILKWVQEKMR